MHLLNTLKACEAQSLTSYLTGRSLSVSAGNFESDEGIYTESLRGQFYELSITDNCLLLMVETGEISETHELIHMAFKVKGGNGRGPSRVGALGCFSLRKLVGLERWICESRAR